MAEKLESLTHYPEFSAAEEIGKGIAEYFAISLPKEELLKIPINILEHLEKPDQKRKIHKRHN